MRALVIDKPGSFGVETVPDPHPAPGSLLVRVEACGVCGTDLHIVDGEFPPTPYPIIPGHEFAGRVVEPGDTGLPVDAKVAVDPSLYCGSCDACRIGRGNLCQYWGAIGDTVDGGFSEYVVVPRANAHLLPDDVDARVGAVVEPLSCAVHAIDLLCGRGGTLIGSRCLVVGGGTMGLLMGQLLLRGGAAEVALVERDATRLELGDTFGLGPRATDVRELPRPGGFDVAVDATGAPAAIEAAFDALGRGGALMVFGVADGDARVSLSPFRIYNDEIQVLGSMAVLNSFAPAVRLLVSGAIDATPLLAEPTYPLEGFADALQAVRRGHGPGTKVQILPTLPSR